MIVTKAIFTTHGIKPNRLKFTRTMKPTFPTPHAAVNVHVAELLKRMKAILGEHLIGLYLDGSLAVGDFDEDSDIDFVAVTDADISAGQFAALQAMHDQLATLNSPYAIQLEGSYMPAHALRRYDPAHRQQPNIERGSGERLKWADHDIGWTVHRHVLHERGIVVEGPLPKTLVDPVSADDLRSAMRAVMPLWADYIFARAHEIRQQGYASYLVLSMCRVLYTLAHGTVVSKRTAAVWAQSHLSAPWPPLIASAWVGRHTSDLPAAPEDVAATLAFVRFALEAV